MRMSILLVCGTCLVLSAWLIWWEKIRPNSPAAPGVSAWHETPHAGDESTQSLRRGEPVPSDADFVHSPNAAVPNNDPADELLQRIQNLFATGDPADRDFIHTNLLPALVRMDPGAAAGFAESLKPDLMRAEALRIVAQTWASLNPPDAANWAAQLPDTKERDLELSLVCNGIGATDPALAVSIAEQRGLGEHTEAVLQDIAQQWSARDFSAARAWVMMQPVGEQRDNLLAHIAIVRSATVPAEAARLISEQIPAGAVQSEAAISVIHQWGTQDMAGAAAWAGLFPPGALREHAERELSGIAAYQYTPPENKN